MLITSRIPAGSSRQWWKHRRLTTPIKAAEFKLRPRIPVNCGVISALTYPAYAPRRKLFMTNHMDDFPLLSNTRMSAISAPGNPVDQYGVNLIIASIDSQPELIRAASSAAGTIFRDDMRLFLYRLEPLSNLLQ